MCLCVSGVYVNMVCGIFVFVHGKYCGMYACVCSVCLYCVYSMLMYVWGVRGGRETLRPKARGC